MKTFFDWAKQYAAAVERLKAGYFDDQTTEKLGENVAELKAEPAAVPIETVADALEAITYVKNEVAEVCVPSNEVDSVLEACADTSWAERPALALRWASAKNPHPKRPTKKLRLLSRATGMIIKIRRESHPNGPLFCHRQRNHPRRSSNATNVSGEL